MEFAFVSLEEMFAPVEETVEDDAKPEKARPNLEALEAYKKRSKELLSGKPEDLVARYQNIDNSGLSDFEIEDSKGRIVRWLLTHQSKIYHSAVDKTCTQMHAQANTLTNDDKNDLIWEGLRKALKAFDTTRETGFSTFAFICIKNETKTRLKEIFSKNEYEVSIDAPIGKDFSDDDKDTTMLDKIACEYHDPQVDMRQKHIEVAMHKILERLDPQTRCSIVNYYGLFGTCRMTEADIGEFMGMSQASVSKKIGDGLIFLAENTTPEEKAMIQDALLQ